MSRLTDITEHDRLNSSWEIVSLCERIPHILVIDPNLKVFLPSTRVVAHEEQVGKTIPVQINCSIAMRIRKSAINTIEVGFGTTSPYAIISTR